jgi:hypothetical protein
MENVRLRSDLVLLPLDGDAIAFSEGAQCLFGLNQSAALIVHELQQGTQAAELAGRLVARGLVGAGEAAHWVSATLDALATHGMLADGASPPPARVLDEDQGDEQLIGDVPSYQPIEPVAEQRYRLLGTCALIRFGHADQAAWVNTVLGHLAVADKSAPSTVLDIHATRLPNGELRSDIYRDGRPVGCALRASRLAPLVKAAFWQAAINAHRFLYYFHAGAVGTDTHCIILPAAAGSGKSSLTGALVHRGFRYFSDEVALIEPGFRVAPMPLAMAIKSTGWDLMARYFPVIPRLAVHIRTDAKALRYLPPPRGSRAAAPLPVSHIFFPKYQADAGTKLEPVSRSDALGRLMGECLALSQRLDRGNVEQLLAWIRGVDCYSLTFDSLDDAVGLIVGTSGFVPSRILTSQ